MGIKSQSDYAKRYREAPRLPHGAAGSALLISDPFAGNTSAAAITVDGPIVVHVRGLVLSGGVGTAAIAVRGGATVMLQGCELTGARGASAVVSSKARRGARN